MIDYGNWNLILISITDVEVPSWFKWGFEGLPRHCGEQCGSNSRSAGCIKHVLYCKAQACKPGRILFLCKTPSRDTIFDRTHNCHRNSWGQVCDQDSKPWIGTSFLWIPWESPQGLNLLGQFNVYILYFLIWLLSVKSILAVGILADFLVFVFSVICFIVSCPATYIIFNLFRLLRFCSRSFLFWWGVICQCRIYCSYYFSLDDTYNFVTCYLFVCMPVFTLPLWLHNSVPFIYSSFILIIWCGVFF